MIDPSRVSKLLGFALLISAAGACRSVRSDSAWSSQPASLSLDDELCPRYPLSFAPDPDAQKRAEASLLALALEEQSSPSLDWSKARGTLRSLGELNISICKDSQNLNEAVSQLLGKAPELFQLDLSEWNLPEAKSCADIGQNSHVTIRLKRKPKGPAVQNPNREFLHFVASRRDNKVVISKVYGDYLPPSSQWQSLLASCDRSTKAESSLIAQLQKESLPIALLDQCKYQKSLSYQVKANDKVALDSASYWDWFEQNKTVYFVKRMTAVITVNEKNLNADLKRSDAHCSDSATGFELSLDPFTKKIKTVKNGLGCNLCASSK